MALAFGRYQVAAPVCLSTGQPPQYPAPSFKAALLAFDNLNLHTLEVDKFTSVETMQTPTCTVTLVRPTFRNDSDRYSQIHVRHFVLTPDDCGLQVTAAGIIYVATKATSTVFNDTNEGVEELPYEVTAVDGGYALTSVDTAEVDALWGAYGCASADRIKTFLTALH